MSDTFEPVYVPADDVDLYGVADEGWYVLDEDFRIVCGPFDTRSDCMKAIADGAKPEAA